MSKKIFQFLAIFLFFTVYLISCTDIENIIQSSSSSSISSSSTSQSNNIINKIYIVGNMTGMNHVLMSNISPYTWSKTFLLSSNKYYFLFDDSDTFTGDEYGKNGWEENPEKLTLNIDKYSEVTFYFITSNNTYYVEIKQITNQTQNNSSSTYFSSEANSSLFSSSISYSISSSESSSSISSSSSIESSSSALSSSSSLSSSILSSSESSSSISSSSGIESSSSALSSSSSSSLGFNGIRIHFKKPTTWNNATIYAWIGANTELCGSWPGTSMINEGNDWYFKDFTNQSYVNIIFSDNGYNKTPDLMNITNECWYMNSMFFNKNPDLLPLEMNLYMKKPINWSTVSLYFWNTMPNPLYTTWPGVQMNSIGNDWYYYKLTNIYAANVIFSDSGKNQTANLYRIGDGWFKDNTWYDENPESTSSSSSSSQSSSSSSQSSSSNQITIYFKNSSGWNSPYIYTWLNPPPNVIELTGSWPGAPMTLLSNNWYYKTITGVTSLNLIFSDNGLKQTADLTRSGDGWYYNGAWYNENPEETIPPEVSLVYPTNNSLLTGIVQLSANATDNVGISKVEFYINARKIGTVTSSPYNIYWNSAYVTNGNYYIYAKAYDLVGNYSYSSSNLITTQNTNILTNRRNVFSWDNATVYFVIIDRFYDGNPANNNSYGRVSGTGYGDFHGGDLRGLIIKLTNNYFTDLGVNAIWITAPYEQIHGWVCGKDNQFKYYAYHGYWVLDYTVVDANMGTEDDLSNFIELCHQRGIRVLFDIVMNHAGYPNIKDLAEFNIGVLRPGWENAQLNNYHDFIDYQSYNWINWWGPNWIRAGFPGHDQPGNDDYTMSLAFLPDFKTESTAYIDIPNFLKNKSTTRATYIPNYTVSDYIIKWLTDWVRKYGVDGFRVDTAKHVRLQEWAKLKTNAVNALREWKNNNPTKKLDDLDFWMVAEVWGHGVAKSDYFNVGKFDAVINFNFVNSANEAANGNYGNIEGTYSYYANVLNSDPAFNVLSYISSHDTSIFYNGDNERQKRVGAILLLCPGAVQIYYGDENCRAPSSGCSDVDQHTRSPMPWPGNTSVLNHWQKIGQFRNNHIAVGAGTHTKIKDNPYTFVRVYDKDDIYDKVLIVMGVTGTQTINVSGIFENGKILRDYYTGNTAQVVDGYVTFTPGSDILLIEEQ